MDEVLLTREQQWGVITLNRPQALNALTLPMIKAIHAQLLAWQEDSEVLAVLIRQSPESKAFCAGGDVRWLFEAGLAHHAEQMAFFYHEYHLNHCIYHYPKPYIALMNGVTMGGGVGISLHGAHPVASERFVFAMPETAIGFFPDIGASYLLSRCPDAFGLYLGLTGKRLGAMEAKTLGLIKAVVSASDMQALFHELLMLDLSKDAFHAISTCLNRFMVFESSSLMSELAPLVQDTFGQHSIASMLQVLKEKNTSWHHEVFESLQKKSPLSLKVTHKQLQKARSMTFDDCLTMDYGLVGHFMQDHDFYEGVRALLIDKDNLPSWRPDSLEKVTASMVQQYFTWEDTLCLPKVSG